MVFCGEIWSPLANMVPGPTVPNPNGPQLNASAVLLIRIMLNISFVQQFLLLLLCIDSADPPTMD